MLNVVNRQSVFTTNQSRASAPAQQANDMQQPIRQSVYDNYANMSQPSRSNVYNDVTTPMAND